MADPQNPVGQVGSGNEESENNDRCFGLYESLGDPCPLVKRKRSFSPRDEDYVLEKEV
jgi:hypothetical protein